MITTSEIKISVGIILIRPTMQSVLPMVFLASAKVSLLKVVVDEIRQHARSVRSSFLHRAVATGLALTAAFIFLRLYLQLVIS